MTRSGHRRGMPTLEVIAERLAGLYWRLMAREDVPESTLDALFDAVAGLDTAGGDLEAPTVRRVLDRRVLDI